MNHNQWCFYYSNVHHFTPMISNEHGDDMFNEIIKGVIHLPVRYFPVNMIKQSNGHETKLGHVRSWIS